MKNDIKSKFDGLDIESMGFISLQDTKYMLECELSWLEKDLTDTTESLMLDNALDAYSKFSNLLNAVNYKLALMRQENK